ncbi:MAG: mitofilin family membrane protein, partial [Planctomycetota bacterium]
MSSIARIFIVLNLLLGALVLGWASQYLGDQQNYKDQLETYTKEKTAEVASLNEELTTFKSRTAEVVESQNRIRSERDTTKALLESTQATLDKTNADESELRASLTALQQNVSAIENSRDEAQRKYEDAMAQLADAKDARRQAEEASKDAGDAQRDAEEARDNANRRIAELEELTTSQEKEIAKLNTDLDVLRVAVGGSDTIEQLSQPQIDGAVVAVSYDVQPGLVGINRGKADGVRVGFTFNLYHGKDFKGV